MYVCMYESAFFVGIYICRTSRRRSLTTAATGLLDDVSDSSEDEEEEEEQIEHKPVHTLTYVYVCTYVYCSCILGCILGNLLRLESIVNLLSMGVEIHCFSDFPLKKCNNRCFVHSVHILRLIGSESMGSLEAI